MQRMKKLAVWMLPLILMSLLCGCAMPKEKVSEYTDSLLKERLSGRESQVVDSFVAEYITKDVEMDDAMKERYTDLCREILRGLKYEAGEPRRTGTGKYEIPVTVQPSDVFVNFADALKQPADELVQKAENGEYRGSEEEIRAQMHTEFLEYSYHLLEKSASDAKTGPKKDVLLHVQKDKNGGFRVEESDFSSLFVQILRLDEIQD